MDAGTLFRQLQGLAPIDHIAIGDPKDKATWRIDFAKAATDAQRSAVAAALAVIDPSAPPVPTSVHMWQAKAALQAVGKLDAASAAVAASGNQALLLAWEYAPEISRDSPSVSTLGQAIGLKPADIDALFIAADAVSV